VTGPELSDLAEWILDRWPQSRAWAKADRLLEDFAPLKGQAVADTVKAMYRNGRASAPAPSEVIRAVHDRRAYEETGEPIDCTTEGRRHVWAIWEEDSMGRRRGMCAVCKVERWFADGKLRTKGELDTLTGP
jgi:hypothetical protein